MSMLPDPSLEGFLEHTFTIDMEYTVAEWASLAAGLIKIMHEIKELEAVKGPMPENMRKHFAVLDEVATRINMRMKIEEAEYRQTEPKL